MLCDQRTSEQAMRLSLGRLNRRNAILITPASYCKKLARQKPSATHKIITHAMAVSRLRFGLAVVAESVWPSLAEGVIRLCKVGSGILKLQVSQLWWWLNASRRPVHERTQINKSICSFPFGKPSPGHLLFSHPRKSAVRLLLCRLENV